MNASCSAAAGNALTVLLHPQLALQGKVHHQTFQQQA
jgi:hypothetical protein